MSNNNNSPSVISTIQSIIDPSFTSRIHAYKSLLQLLFTRLELLASPLAALVNASDYSSQHQSQTSIFEFTQTVDELHAFLENFIKPEARDDTAGLISWYGKLIDEKMQNLTEIQRYNNAIIQLNSNLNLGLKIEGVIEDCNALNNDIRLLYEEVAILERQPFTDSSLRTQAHDMVTALNNERVNWNHHSNEIEQCKTQFKQLQTNLTNGTIDNTHIQSELINLRNLVIELTQTNCTVPQQLAMIDSLHQSIISFLEESQQSQNQIIRQELNDFKKITEEFHRLILENVQNNHENLQALLISPSNLELKNIQNSIRRREKLRDLQVYPNHIVIGNEVLGAGAFGEVRRASFQQRPVAVKIFQSRNETFTTQEKFIIENEAIIMSLCPHPSILQVYGICFPDPRTSYIVMELGSGGSLSAYLADMAKAVTPSLSFAWIGDIFSALANLHQRNITHGDIKPENILLTALLGCKVTDFGLSKQRFASTFGSTSTSAAGSLLYMAPEVRYLNKKPVPRSDVYSAGITSYQVLSRSSPPSYETKDQILNYAKTFSSEIITQFFENCLKENHRERVTSNDALTRIIQIQQNYPDPRTPQSHDTRPPIKRSASTLLRQWLDAKVAGISDQVAPERLQQILGRIEVIFEDDFILTLEDLHEHADTYTTKYFTDKNIPPGFAKRLAKFISELQPTEQGMTRETAFSSPTKLSASSVDGFDSPNPQPKDQDNVNSDENLKPRSVSDFDNPNSPMPLSPDQINLDALDGTTNDDSFNNNTQDNQPDSTGTDQVPNQQDIAPPAATSDVTPDATPDVTPDATPDAASTVPTADPDTVPDNDDDDDNDNDGGVDPRDIEHVLAQIPCSRAEAIQAIKDNNYNLVDAILQLTNAMKLNDNINSQNPPPADVDQDITDDETSMDPRDIDLVMSLSGATRSAAVIAIKQKSNDLVGAAISLFHLREQENNNENFNPFDGNERAPSPRDVNLVKSLVPCSDTIALTALQHQHNDLVSAIIEGINVGKDDPSSSPPPIEVTRQIDSRDIDIIMTQANCSQEIATETLQKNDYDVVSAIIELTQS